jgi:phage gp29-like protein
MARRNRNKKKINSVASKVEQVQMIDKKKTRRSTATKRIVPATFYRVNKNIRQFFQDIQTAENKINPRRTELLRTYQDTMLDTHISSQLSKRADKTLNKPFIIKNAEGEKDDDWTEKFNRTDLVNIYRWILESVPYGHSLIELGNIVDDMPLGSELVLRENVIPETGEIKTNTQDFQGWPYRTSPWYIEAGDRIGNDKLGLLMKLSPLAIMKRASLFSWYEFNELYGKPWPILKTARTDGSRDELTAQLANLGTGTTITLSAEEEETLELISPSEGAAFKSFEDFLRWVNEEISKLISHETMTSENGSSLSQSETHLQIFEEVARVDEWLLTTTMNDSMIPNLRAIGVQIPEGYTWAVEQIENTNQLFEMVKGFAESGLLPDKKWAEEKFNIVFSDEPIPENEPTSTAGKFKPFT